MNFQVRLIILQELDPYNDRPDIKCSITDYVPEEKHDVAICLGSINFGGPDKIVYELSKHVVANVILNTGGLILVNPWQDARSP